MIKPNFTNSKQCNELHSNSKNLNRQVPIKFDGTLPAPHDIDSIFSIDFYYCVMSSQNLVFDACTKMETEAFSLNR